MKPDNIFTRFIIKMKNIRKKIQKSVEKRIKTNLEYEFKDEKLNFRLLNIFYSIVHDVGKKISKIKK